MIQHVNILSTDGKSMLFREYGATKVDKDLLAGFLSAFSGFMMEISQSEIKSTITGSSRFIYSMAQNVLVVICTDLEDKEEEVSPILEEILAKFLARYGNVLKQQIWEGERRYFDDFIEDIDNIVLGPIKVSILGYAGVGKTTLTKLIVGQDVNLEYVPTITADIAKYDSLGNRSIVLWDFAGQVQFIQDLWISLLKGTRIVILVTDSTYNNVLTTKKILDEYLTKNQSDIIVFAIANKQDLPNRLTAKFVEKILKVPTFGMVAINSDYQVIIHEILKENIEKINLKDGILN